MPLRIQAYGLQPHALVHSSSTVAAIRRPSRPRPDPRGHRGGDPWIGRTVADRYTIVSLLGQGGMGRVYVADQQMGSTKRRLALKMLLPEHASNPEIVARFFRECEIASLVEHPNVVRIYDFGETGGVLYIAMELVPGRSLASILANEGPLPLERALPILSQVCRGVAAAHDRGIVHRDLKPDNIMVVSHPGEPDFVKVLDFGIAKMVAGGSRPELTRLGEVLGSPPYMSPEQLMGEEVDARTDVYALGIVAYETLTGTTPFHASDLMEWAAQHVGGDPLSFDATPAGKNVPEPVRASILHALAKKRADRPADPRSFLGELVAPSTVVAPRLSTVFATPLPIALMAPRGVAPRPGKGPHPVPGAMPAAAIGPGPPKKRPRRLFLRFVFALALLGVIGVGTAFLLDVQPSDVVGAIPFEISDDLPRALHLD